MFAFSRRPLISRLNARSGASLVLVLAAMAMISFMLLAIMTLIQAESHGSLASNELTKVRMLSDLPEKVVISQIRRATSTPPGLSSIGYNWASQPGMIWVFGTTKSTNSPRADVHQMFKLYSARKVVLDGNGPADSIDGPLADANELQGWADNPAMYTDINEPARTGTAQKPYYAFPILDPRAENLEVDGFKLYTRSRAPNDNPPIRVEEKMVDATGSEPKLVMPVAWLYVLQDGSIIAPDRNSRPGEADFGGGGGSGTAKPTRDNPIVGRIAYWTDDESCKLNINTASEPAPWSPPRTHTTTDESYAQSIPAKGEYYRNSGHPAYTSLSPVLRHLGQSGGGSTTTATTEPASTIGDGVWQQHITDWHQWLPHSFDTTADSERKGSNGGTQSPRNAATVKRERSFASVDEMVYTTATYSGSNQRTPYQDSSFNSSEVRITPDDLSKVRFFLTPHNRAPETNLFNRPKISLWPLMADAADRTDIDKKFSLATRLSGHQYAFQRATKWLSDAAPGSSQDQSADSALRRNTELLGMLQTFTEQDVPGFGDKFVNGATGGKWTPQGRDQLLASMFDFVRSGVNAGTPFNQTIAPVIKPQYNYLPPSASSGIDGIASGTAVPLRVNSETGGEHDPYANNDAPHIKGYGRFPTITRVALVFIATAGTPGPAGQPPKTTKMQAFVVLEPFLPAPGIMPAAPRFSCRLQNLNHFQIEDKALGFKQEFQTYFGCPASKLPTTTPLGHGDHSSYPSLISQFVTLDGLAKNVSPNVTGDDLNFVAVSDIIDVPTPATPPPPGAPPKVRFHGFGNVVIEVEDHDHFPVQAINVIFPDTDIPVPVLPPGATGASVAARIGQMLSAPALMGPAGLIQPGDVVRSAGLVRATRTVPQLGSPHGDARVLAGRIDIEPYDHLFEVETLLYDAAVGSGPINPVLEQTNAMCLRDGGVSPVAQAVGSGGPQVQVNYGLAMRTVGNQTAALTYHSSTPPAVPPGNVGALNADGLAGDFDTGPGNIEDGPYINFPDTNTGANQLVAGLSGSGGYFGRGGSFVEDTGTTFSPWRQISSGIAFGSLPTGVYGWAGDSSHVRPWQTLLFCPNPASRTTPAGTEPDFATKHDHFGFLTPRDHLWLEYFWMPPVEPESLSDGYATEGKVNINYQIAPFYWIKRSTALWGALHGVRMTAIPNAVVLSGQYKSPSASPFEFRYSVDAEKTLAAFDDRFFDPTAKTLNVFRSPSEICEMFLIPKRLTGTGHSYPSTAPDPDTFFPSDKHDAYTNALDWWKGSSADNGFDATGDNLREEPYAQLYPRLCTRSNVYTVHYRVQVLRKSRSTKPEQWVEGQDHIAAEYRGQTTIERYLDPATQADTTAPAASSSSTTPKQTIPDFAGSINTGESLDDYYKYRVTNRRRFSP